MYYSIDIYDKHSGMCYGKDSRKKSTRSTEGIEVSSNLDQSRRF